MSVNKFYVVEHNLQVKYKCTYMCTCMVALVYLTHGIINGFVIIIVFTNKHF